MTRERVRAAQTTAPPAAVRMVQVTIAAIGAHTVTVQLPSGSTVAGLRVAGLTYTVGAAATVLIQEPAVGPVLPTV